MKVKEAIKTNHFVITRSGDILAINNGDGMNLKINSKLTKDEILNINVLKVQNTNDYNKDYHTNYELIRV